MHLVCSPDRSIGVKVMTIKLREYCDGDSSFQMLTASASETTPPGSIAPDVFRVSADTIALAYTESMRGAVLTPANVDEGRRMARSFLRIDGGGGGARASV